MGKGKIITSKDNDHGIILNDNNKEIAYWQPFAKELGLKVGSRVRFDAVVDPKTKEKTAVNVELYKKGIITGKDNDTGMIIDENFGEIPVYEPMMEQQGIASGAFVKYDLVLSEKGVVAVNVKLTPDPDPDTK